MAEGPSQALGPRATGARSSFACHDRHVRSLGDLAERAMTAFTTVHRTVFLGDPAANPRLPVDVLEPALVVDTPTLVLLTPWTLNGLLFPPDDAFPEQLSIAERPRPVFTAELAPLGRYRSVNLVGDVSKYETPEQARTIARSWAPPFHAAVRAARAAAGRG